MQGPSESHRPDERSQFVVKGLDWPQDSRSPGMSLCHCRVCQRLVASLLWSVALHPQQVHIQAHGATIQTSFSTLAALGMAPSACMQKRLRRVSAAMLPLFKGLTGEHGALQERSPYAAQMDCPLAPHVTQAHGERGQEGTPASVGCARRYPSGGAEGLPVGARCHVGARRGAGRGGAGLARHSSPAGRQHLGALSAGWPPL